MRIYNEKYIMLIFFSCQSSTITPDLLLLKELEENPERAAQICPKLSGKDAKKRFNSLSMRPHLWSNPASMDNVQSPRKVGPASKHLIPSVSIQTPTHRENQECEQTQCWEKRALAEEEVDKIIVQCGGIKKKLWRSECAFLVAESHLPTKGYAHSAHLCLYSGDFAANCFMHLSYRLAESIPPALSEDRSEWDAFVQDTHKIQTFWEDKDNHFGNAMVQQLWAKALDVSYTKAGIVAGNPIDYLPEEARPHIHAAASAHLMRMEGATSFSLQEWANRTQRALDARLKGKDMRPPRAYVQQKSQNSWPSDTKDDAHIPATYYMADGRRTFHSDANIDLLITTLEAASRSQNGQNLVEEGKKSSIPLVRWTAMRLSQR